MVREKESVKENMTATADINRESLFFGKWKKNLHDTIKKAEQVKNFSVHFRPMFPVWVFGVSYCGLYCPNVFVFLACGGFWCCEHILFCV